MAYLFNGATHIINRADAVVQTFPLTIHGRIRLTAVADGLVHCILGLWEAGSDNGFRLQVELNAGTMKARCGSKAGGVASNANSTTSITDTNWHSVVGEISAANARQVWLDNGGNGTNATSLSPGTLTKTSIGAHDNGGTLSGNIAHELADVAVWSGTLTSDERASLVAGVSPALIRPDILEIYLPLLSGSTDFMGGAFTVTAATVADHPRVYMPGRSMLVKTAAASGISGTASISEADDTVAATGTVLVSGAASITEAGDTAIGAAGVLISGVLAATQADDTLASTGALAIAAALAVSEADDSLAASGALPIVGTLSGVQADDTIVATGVGSSLNTGSLSVTEADDTVSAATTLAIVGVAAVTEAGDAASGAAGLSIGGAASIAEGDDTSAATGALAITGLLSANDNDDTLAGVITLSTEAVSRLTGLRPTSGASSLRKNLSTGSRPAAVSRG